MSGTSIPFFLYPTGSSNSLPAGFRSFFAFWMGGGGFNPGGTAATLPHAQHFFAHMAQLKSF